MKKSRFFLAVISLFVAITSSAQNISVTGVVTDASTGEDTFRVLSGKRLHQGKQQ